MERDVDTVGELGEGYEYSGTVSRGKVVASCNRCGHETDSWGPKEPPTAAAPSSCARNAETTRATSTRRLTNHRSRR